MTESSRAINDFLSTVNGGANLDSELPIPGYDNNVELGQVPSLTDYIKIKYPRITSALSRVNPIKASAIVALFGVGLLAATYFMTTGIKTPEEIADLSIKTHEECTGIESEKSNLNGVCYDGKFLRPMFYGKERGSIVLERLDILVKKDPTSDYVQTPAYVPVR